MSIALGKDVSLFAPDCHHYFGNFTLLNIFPHCSLFPAAQELAALTREPMVPATAGRRRQGRLRRLSLKVGRAAALPPADTDA